MEFGVVFTPMLLREVNAIRQEIWEILIQDYLPLSITTLDLEPEVQAALLRYQISTLGELLTLNDFNLRNLSPEDALNRKVYKQCRQQIAQLINSCLAALGSQPLDIKIKKDRPKTSRHSHFYVKEAVKGVVLEGQKYGSSQPRGWI